MAATMTYTSLVEDVQNYLERGASSSVDPMVFDQIPRLIALAETRIAVELKVLGFKRVVTGTLTAGVAAYDKPERWRETLSINIGTGATFENRKQLFARSYEYLVAYHPDRTATDEPEFYADYDYDHWLIAPTPDQDYPWEISYYEKLQQLDSSNETNWLTDIAPQLLLYATLLEAAPFLKNDERVATWQQLYDRAMAAITGEDLDKITDRNTVRKAA
jgi:hypothetical protein